MDADEAMSAEAAEKAAVRYLRLNDAIIDLRDNWDDYSEALKLAQKEGDTLAKTDTKTYQTLNKMRQAVSALTGAEEDLVDDNFLAKHADDIKKAANGSEKSLASLRKAISKATFEKFKVQVDDSELDALNAELDALPEGAEVEISANTQGALAPIWDLISEIARTSTSAEEASARITSALSGLQIEGVDITPLT